MKEFYSIVDGKVAAEKYTYSDYDFDIVDYASKSDLNRLAYENYRFSAANTPAPIMTLTVVSLVKKVVGNKTAFLLATPK